MNTDQTKIELDFISPKKRKRSFLAIVVYISLIAFFVLTSSYKNPTTRINNELVKSSSNQIQYLLQAN